MILNKKQMTEEDIKLHFITPAILKGWSKNFITMETKITDGMINLRGNFVTREKPKKVDYLLYINANHPITMPTEIKFEITQHIATMSTSPKGWTKELNLVSWNDKEAKYDIREWSPDHTKMGKGVTLSQEEMEELKKALL